jgi:guanine nucleotide-binding protein subunit beta-2-like 1 protein
MLTASWDHTLRLWEIATGMCIRKFIGHTNDVMSVTFTPDDRFISALRDHTIRVWNTIGEEKTCFRNPSSNLVTCVRYSPDQANPIMVFASYGKLAYVWDMEKLRLKDNHIRHMTSANIVSISPDVSLCTRGSKDGAVMLWDLSIKRPLYTLETGSVVNTPIVSPTRYWLCAATDKFIRVWGLQTKCIVDDLMPVVTSANSSATSDCISHAWSAVGNCLFPGYTNSLIRVWKVIQPNPTQPHPQVCCRRIIIVYHTAVR